MSKPEKPVTVKQKANSNVRITYYRGEDSLQKKRQRIRKCDILASMMFAKVLKYLT